MNNQIQDPIHPIVMDIKEETKVIITATEIMKDTKEISLTPIKAISKIKQKMTEDGQTNKLWKRRGASQS